MSTFTSDAVDRQIIARSKRTAKGCLEFGGHRNRAGYGIVKIGGSVQLAHRAVWSALHGPIPQNVEVCHRCDNPPCVEREHLFAGSRLENQSDMYAKGRGRKARGEAHGRAKLTDVEVAQLRDLRAAGSSYGKLATRFRVSKSAVFDICHGNHRRGP